MGFVLEMDVSVSARSSGDACQPEMVFDWDKIKRLRLKRRIYEIDSKIVACLSQDSFVVCLVPVLRNMGFAGPQRNADKKHALGGGRNHVVSIKVLMRPKIV